MKQEEFSVYPSPFYAGLVTHRLFATWDFYTERLGFRTMDEGGGCVRLQHPCGAQLILIEAEMGATPAELVSATDGRGFWLTLEVGDVEAERRELLAAGVSLQPLPAAACWLPGAFTVSDPNGVLVVIAPRSAVTPARQTTSKSEFMAVV